LKAFLQRNLLRALLVLLVYLAVVIFSVTSNALYQNIEGVLYDGLIKRSLEDQTETRIVLVDIDEKSLSTEGAWPWPRAKLATLINRLTRDYQVGVLGIDIVFPEARSHDEQLIHALHHDNLVMSQVLDFNPDSSNQTGQFVAIPEKLEGKIKSSITGYIANHPSLVAAQPNVAHITPTIDLDGKVRRIYPIACGPMGCTPTLSLKMLDVMHGGAPVKREKIGRTLNTEWSANDHLTLHLDQDDQLLIPFALKTNAFTSIPAHEVLHLNAPRDLLKNAIVILGSTSMGLGDYVATPVSNLTPGLTLHAEIIAAPHWVLVEFRDGGHPIFDLALKVTKSAFWLGCFNKFYLYCDHVSAILFQKDHNPARTNSADDATHPISRVNIREYYHESSA